MPHSALPRSPRRLFLPGLPLLPLLPLLLLLAALPGRSVSQQDAESPSGATADEPIPAERASPRAALRTFLQGIIEGDKGDEAALQRAIETLDLSSIPAGLRDQEGRRLAIKLKAEVLDKYKFIDYEEIPEAPESGFYAIYSDGENEIVLAPVEGGDWKFTRASVESIDRLAEEWRDRPVVTGAKEVRNLVLPSEWLKGLVPDFLKDHGFILQWWQWIGIAILAIIGLIIGRILVFTLLGLTGRRLVKLGIETTEQERRRLLNPLGYAFAAFIWFAFDTWLDLPTGVADKAYGVATIIAGIGIIVFLLRLVDLLCIRIEKYADTTESKYDDLLVPFVRGASRIVIIIVGTLTILDRLQLNLTGMFAGLGIGGLAVALAAKDMIANLFGSITVIADRPFQIGDWVVVGDVEGTVERLGFRSTRIRTFYNSLITVPNSTLTTAVVDNYGERQYRRYKTHVSITYNTPPNRIEAFCEGIRKIILDSPYTRKDYYHVYVHQFGPSSIDILLYMFFQTPDWATELRERHRLNVDIIRLAKRLGVEFAFPTQTVYLERGTGPAEPDTSPFPARVQIEGAYHDGRHTAAELVRTTLGPKGTVPPPVQFSPTGRQPGESEDSGE